MPMRPATVRVSSATFSPWIPLNRMSSAFGVAIGVKLPATGSLTYSVQHTFDDIYERTQAFSISRTTTTATVTKTTHGLSVGDWLLVTGAGAPLDGEYLVASVTDADTFTYTVLNSGVTASPGTAWMQTARVFPHEDLAAKTASDDGNYAFPPRACRLRVTTYSSGFADMTVIAGGK